jgi:hypothetical protein
MKEREIMLPVTPEVFIYLNSRSNLLTVVKSRSTWVLTSKTSSNNPYNPVDQVNTYVW